MHIWNCIKRGGKRASTEPVESPWKGLFLNAGQYLDSCDNKTNSLFVGILLNMIIFNHSEVLDNFVNLFYPLGG